MRLQTVSNAHRVLGIIVTFFIIVVCLTGILILHTDELRLQEKFTDSEILLDWYGIAPQGTPRAIQLNDSWITQVDTQVYLDTLPLFENTEALQGVVSLGEFIIVALEKSIYLLTREGVLVERLNSLQGIPPGIEAIAAIPPDIIILVTTEGIFESDLDLITWRRRQEINVTWSSPVVPPPELTERLLQHYRGEGLPLERVILDLHSGRILGTFGVLLVDVITIILLILTVSGWWSWLKRRAIQKELDLEQ
jgi:hypothetical protein